MIKFFCFHRNNRYILNKKIIVDQEAISKYNTNIKISKVNDKAIHVTQPETKNRNTLSNKKSMYICEGLLGVLKYFANGMWLQECLVSQSVKFRSAVVLCNQDVIAGVLNESDRLVCSTRFRLARRQAWSGLAVAMW